MTNPGEAHPATAGDMADSLIAIEVAGQDAMWGPSNERADVSRQQLMHAAMAQLNFLYDRQRGLPYSKTPPSPYPRDWSGWRDYGSDVANLVVAAAFIRQEIKRKIAAGEDTTRTKRRPDQPYTADQPAEPMPT